MNRHALTVRVETGDLDDMGHVNNSIYLRWIERAVHGHWARLARPQEFAAFLWVFVRHEVDYLRPALLGETLTIGTELFEVRRARAWYRTMVHRDGTHLVDARSCCCCLDAASRSLTVIPRETAARFMALPTVEAVPA